MMRGLGALPDKDEDVFDDLASRHVGLLLGASPALFAASANVDYSGFLGKVPDQGASSSCVGQAFATACYVRAAIAGYPIPRPSAKAIYDFARLVDMPAVLEDVGSRPRAAILGMREHGLVAEERWPLTPSNVNELPPLDVFVNGADALLTGHYRIAGNVPALIRQALASGFVPVFAMPVDEAYLRYDGSAVYHGANAGAVLGRHMQAIIGCSDDSFLVANSWGRQWGIAGMAQIDAAYFATGAVSDVLVPTVIPARVS